MKTPPLVASIGTLLRETAWYTAVATARGVRITAKGPKAPGWPKTGVIGPRLWRQLATMSNEAFNGSLALEVGITSDLEGVQNH